MTKQRLQDIIQIAISSVIIAILLSMLISNRANGQVIGELYQKGKWDVIDFEAEKDFSLAGATYLVVTGGEKQRTNSYGEQYPFREPYRVKLGKNKDSRAIKYGYMLTYYDASGKLLHTRKMIYVPEGKRILLTDGNEIKGIWEQL